MDCDMECLKPLEGYLSGRNIVIATEPDIHSLISQKLEQEKLLSNGIMASQPRHPFFKHVIDTLEKRTTKKELFYHKIMHSTGPFMLGDAYKEYSSRHADAPPLVDAELFQPFGDPIKKETYRKYCDTLESKGIKKLALAKKVCVSYLNGDKATEKTLTVHHWTHSWVRTFKDGIDKKYGKFNINDLRKPKMQSKQTNKDVKSARRNRRSLIQN